ncbi:hypothetical protein L6452_23478 [Arctium lappa]|uniref:Uncharacterized protein n=1 Tax=Arctium lappa TaxID=4217 RepID=A0ACB9B3B7_ARCLA|nr:hypothetical protein L6452_23478 [Arctium lappa]
MKTHMIETFPFESRKGTILCVVLHHFSAFLQELFWCSSKGKIQRNQSTNLNISQQSPKFICNAMTRMDGPSSSSSSNDDDKNLEWLLEAFGSKTSIDDIASAYCQAGHDLRKASDIICNMLGSSSSNDVPISTDDLIINEPPKVLSRSKPKHSGISVGSVSGIIGADYGRSRASTKEARAITKPVKLMSNKFPVTQIWVEKPPVNATNETMNKDVEQFLLKMLGDGFKLDMEVIKEVVGGCGYDVRESMEKLMDMSSPTLDLRDVTSSMVDQTKSMDTCQDLDIKCEEKLQFSDASGSGREHLEKEVLCNLFTVPERSEVGLRKNLPKREPRTRKYGVVTGPLEDPATELRAPIVKKEVNGDGNEQTEDNYENLREAAMEFWITMKKYYRAAADAYAKGSYELADKLTEEGHFFMAKAREANETSAKMLTQTRDDGEAISIDLTDYEPREAIRLLKTQLKSMSGIPSIHYLKVMVGTEDDVTKQKARKRLISKLLERDAISWTEEQDGQLMAIRIDVINPKRLSFNKK